MPDVQSVYGKVSVFEDFNGMAATFSVADATVGTRLNDLTLVAVSGQSEVDWIVTRGGGHITFNGAGAAGDGIAVISSPLKPSVSAPMTLECRFMMSSITDGRYFIGWQETASLSETVNPYTLSGTTLTANAAGNVVGFYFDSQATTDDFRFMAGTNSAAATTAAVQGALGGQTTLGSLGIRAQWTPTASSMVIARVILYPDGAAEGYFGGVGVPGSGRGLEFIGRVKAGVLSTTALYHPHGHFVAQSTGDPTATVDYFAFTGARDWAA